MNEKADIPELTSHLRNYAEHYGGHVKLVLNGAADEIDRLRRELKMAHDMMRELEETPSSNG